PVDSPGASPNGLQWKMRGRWHRARRMLGAALRVLRNESAGRKKALENADNELKAGQADLRRRWEYLEEAQKLSHSGTFGWKVASGEVVWSQETRRILGVSNETNPTLDLVFERIHPEDRDRMRQVRENAVTHGTDLDVEHRLLMPGDIV